MTTTLYYFSGTGNTLKVARDIAAALGDTELVHIGHATEDQVSPQTDAVGFLFPVYAWAPPAAVTRFLDRVHLTPNQYAFAVCTYAGIHSAVLPNVSKQLRARGVALSAGFAVRMPTNYIVFGGAIPEEKQRALFERARGRVEEICATVRERGKKDVERGGLLSRLFFSGLLSRLSTPSFPGMDARFSVSDSCRGCGTCARVCPAGNIALVDGTPSFDHRCEQCMACLQWCPRRAIEVGTSTAGRERYHHPEVSAQDLMAPSSRPRARDEGSSAPSAVK